MGAFSVTLLAMYERLMEEDLVDGTFERQMIPSSLSSVLPSLSIPLSKLLKPSRPQLDWKVVPF